MKVSQLNLLLVAVKGEGPKQPLGKELAELDKITLGPDLASFPGAQ